MNIEACWFCESAIESVWIPECVEKISRCAFWGCERLRTVEFAEGSRLERVDDWAFGRTPLAAGQVRFPARARVSEKAFADCYE